LRLKSKTTQTLFDLILDSPKTKEEIALELKVSEKTVANALPSLKRELEKDELFYFVENINPDGERVFFAVKNNDFRVKVKNRIFTHSRSDKYPYIVINLPPPPKGFKSWRLFPIGDNHHGSQSENRNFFEAQIDRVKNTPNAIAILKGDGVENSGKLSPGSSMFHQTITPQKQKESFISLLAPIAHKILWAEGGNHDKDRTMKVHGLDVAKDIAQALNVEYFPGAVYADVLCQDYKWDIMSWHGLSGAMTKAGKLNNVMKKREFHSAHIYFMGHVHDLSSVFDFELIKDPKGLKLTYKKRLYILTGSTQGYFKSYAEEWVLPPIPCGYAIAELYCKGSSRPGDFSATFVLE